MLFHSGLSRRRPLSSSPPLLTLRDEGDYDGGDYGNDDGDYGNDDGDDGNDGDGDNGEADLKRPETNITCHGGSNMTRATLPARQSLQESSHFYPSTYIRSRIAKTISQSNEVTSKVLLKCIGSYSCH